jgi:hypothetical protein
LEIRPKKGEYLFPPTLFNVNMGAGDLVVLSPKKLNQDQSTLDGLFFGQGGGGDVFRLSNNLYWSGFLVYGILFKSSFNTMRGL